MTVDFSGRAQWRNYSPTSLGWGGRWDPELHQELLVPFSFTTNRGETLTFGRMHRLVVPIFRAFYQRIDARHPGVLRGDHDEGCFNPNSKLQDGSRSFHTFGIATDTEWLDNPMGVGAKRHGPSALPDDTDDIGRPLMLQWGGTWSDFKDWMHNEFHGTPQDAIDLAAALAADHPISEFDHLMEQLMAWYGSKTEFEDAVQAAAGRGVLHATQANEKGEQARIEDHIQDTHNVQRTTVIPLLERLVEKAGA